MAPLIVEGNTLGQIHRNYNRIVNETIQEVVPEINYEEPDLDNLIKIDVACKNRDVDYIIKVLQCEDMLYVSRAIKRSTWLITDQQYAHIVNPIYISNQLYPNMMLKAFNKFLLHIRLNLRDEKRVDEFFNYYEKRDLKAAFKWLPNCSIQLIESTVRKHRTGIPRHLLKRLFEKSISCLDVYINSTPSSYRQYALKTTTFLLKNNFVKYLDIIEASKTYEVPKFGPKTTKLLMKKCSERVMEKIETYSFFVHIPTVAKFMKEEDIKNFITKNIKNEEMRSLFSYSNIKPLLNRLSVENRFEFIKEVFIDTNNNKNKKNPNKSNLQNIYQWYTYAFFSNAFVDLKKMIRSETNPVERTSMFDVMLKCARNDEKCIRAILKYYRENHINEAFKFKIQFVNSVISFTNTHRFDEETWGYLNDLFSSMDVYNESDRLVKNCIRSIILYRVIHDERIPDIVEQKFRFTTFWQYQKKLSEDEKEKLFSYLYNFLTSKIEDCKIEDKNDFRDAVDVLTDMLDLLLDWNKEIQDFPVILEQVKQVIQIKRMNTWNEDVSILYNVKKSWRKFLFEESIVLNPTQETCINALKHGPEILETYKNEIQSFCLNDKKRIDRFLKKIRIYWSQSLAKNYKIFFINMIEQNNSHKAAVTGLCILFPKHHLTTFLQACMPSESKIDWTRPNDEILSLQKHIASTLYLARPQPSVADILLYSKGDYLQFALPSLNSILHNMKCIQCRKNLTQLLNCPVSLQKHGIRITFAKLNYEELKNLFSDIWKSNKNSSIRATIFNQTFDFLCKQNEPSAIRAMWELLRDFIDNLTFEEDKCIYTKLSKAEKVPMSVRPEFWMKSYKFLKTLPSKPNSDVLIYHLRLAMDKVMEFLDNDFVAEIFFESFDDKFYNKRYDFQYLVAEFVLSTRTEIAHIARYNKILVPILERSFEMWNRSHEGINYIRINLENILSLLNSLLHVVVLERKMILPIPMFTDVLKRLSDNVPIEDNYVLIRNQKLSLDCLKILDKVLKTNEDMSSQTSKSIEDDDEYEDIKKRKFELLYAQTAEELGKLCVNYLKEDLSNYYPSIYMLFAKSFEHVFTTFRFNAVNKMNALKHFLEDKDFVPGYLFVLKSIPKEVCCVDEKALEDELLKIISKHPSNEIRTHLHAL